MCKLARPTWRGLEKMCPINSRFILLQYQLPISKTTKEILKIHETDLHLCTPFQMKSMSSTVKVCNMQKLCVAFSNVHSHPPLFTNVPLLNTITSLSLLVSEGLLKLEDLCIGAPLICLEIVDFHRIQKLIAIKPSHCINGVSHSCDPSIAPW